MATASKETATKENRASKPLPAPNSDFYEFAETLPAEELAIVKKVRAYMETKVQPIINKYWVEDSFPFELLPSFKELNLAGLGMNGYGCPGGSPLLVGLVAMALRIGLGLNAEFKAESDHSNKQHRAEERARFLRIHGQTPGWRKTKQKEQRRRESYHAPKGACAS